MINSVHLQMSFSWHFGPYNFLQLSSASRNSRETFTKTAKRELNAIVIKSKYHLRMGKRDNTLDVSYNLPLKYEFLSEAVTARCLSDDAVILFCLFPRVFYLNIQLHLSSLNCACVLFIRLEAGLFHDICNGVELHRHTIDLWKRFWIGSQNLMWICAPLVGLEP